MAGADVVVKFLADTRQLDGAMKDVEGTGSRMAAVGRTIAGALGGAAIIGAIVKTTKAASALNEQVASTEAIFGKSAKSIEKWAGGAAEDFGQSKRQALEAASSFGNMFSQLGIGEETTVKMSKRMVELASDFASFRDADPTDVLQAQQAAFRGEYDALQKFVPTINAATVETKALEQTGKDNAKALTAQEKATATYALMLEGAGKAVGDFDRTSGSAANQQRKFTANMENLQATIGQALLPVLVQALGMLSKVAEAFQSLPGPVQTAVVALGLFAAAMAVMSALNITSGIAAAVALLPKLGSALVSAGLSIAAYVEKVGLVAVATNPMLVALVAAVAVVGAVVAITGRAENQWDEAREAADRWAGVVIAGAEASGQALSQLRAEQGALTERAKEAGKAADLQFGEVAFEKVLKMKARHEELSGAIAKNTQEQHEAKRAEQERDATLNALAVGIDQTTESTLGAISAMQAYANQMLAAQGGAIGLEASQIQLAQAQQKLTELENSGTATALELAAARNQVDSATLGVANAAISANAKEEAFKATLNQGSIPALEASKRALYDQMAAHGDNTGAIQLEIEKIDGYIWIAGQVPADKTTKFHADTAEATARMLDYKRQLDALPENIRTEALLAINLATTGYAPPGFAAGGIVPGPKGAPLLAVVHGGETVVPVRSAARSNTMTSSAGGGTGPTFNIKIDVAAGVHPAEVGAATVDAIRAYERVNGRAWRNS